MSDELTFTNYQLKAETTAVYPQAGLASIAGITYLTLGLNGEAGEVAEKIKKALRDDDGTLSDEKRKLVGKELGDCLWYLANLASELDFSLEDLAQENLDKLTSRKERGVLAGSGDTR